MHPKHSQTRHHNQSETLVLSPKPLLEYPAIILLPYQLSVLFEMSPVGGMDYKCTDTKLIRVNVFE